MARHRRKNEYGEMAMPISAMIDITFLLIIFFVVTAAMDKEVEDEAIILSKAPHGKPLAKKDPRGIVINVRKTGEININAVEKTMSEITASLTVAALKWGNDMPIIIRGDKDVQHYHIKKVMEAITKTGLYKIRFDALIE
jgi:biopolymer transport protein ExbD